MKDNDAPQIVARDDAASSETISERPQVEVASEDGEGNDRPFPFARSSDFQHIGKPSKNRLARQHRRLYPTKLLHNARSKVGLSVCDGRGNWQFGVIRQNPDPILGRVDSTFSL